MKFNRLQKWSYKAVLALSLVTMFFVVTGADNLYAVTTKPDLPRLSLTGADARWDDAWYPDGRIWLPASFGQPREFLLPVFIENKWRTMTENPKYQVEPTMSFQFSIKYDSTAVRAVGIQTIHPDNPDFRRVHNIDDYDPLAKNFNITWDDFKDNTYKLYLNPLAAEQDRRKGRQIKIVATSSTPLPTTDDFKILLYVRFRIEADITRDLGTSGNTPIYISNDTIKYNDLNISTNAPFENMRAYDPVVAEEYPNPGRFTGLAGIDNSTNQGRWNIEPYLPGVIYLRLSGVLPTFDFRVQRGKGQVPAMTQLAPDLWDMLDPLTVDQNAAGSFNYGFRTVQLINNTSTTRMLDLEIETDQPWLKVRAVNIGGSRIPFGLTRKAYVNWIDNGILADEAIRTPIDEFTQDDKDLYIEFRADPTELDGSPEEKTGIHVGYVTFKSNTADISPVRIRVTFIFFKNPDEKGTGTNSQEYGIHLNVRSVNDVVNSSRLVFGTGPRATMGIDSLYGEFGWDKGLDVFGARFYPPIDAPDSIKNDPKLQNGFGDFNQNDEMNRTGSRDIRSSNDTLQSIIYYVKIHTLAVEDYPVVIEWDIAEFPEGSQLFLRDAVNGQLFNVNMRTGGTPSGPTTRTYTIQDPTITSFVIEYTLGRVIEYVDEFGKPIINKGWNFLSLPVKPLDNFWKSVYPNSVAKPYYFTLSQYQEEEYLRPGVGYFIKYVDDINIDKRFAGSFIREISVAAGNPVRLYPGWNTIGSVSLPVNINSIDFDNYQTDIPNKTFVLDHEVYGYRTDRGYYPTSEIRTGLGYWIKCDANGYLKLRVEGPRSTGIYSNPKESVIASSTMLTVRDNSMREARLYLSADKNANVSLFELPPTPPSSLFDARFNNGGILDNSSLSVLKLQAVDYPLSLTVNNADANYTIMDAVTGEILGTVNKGETKNIVVASQRSNAVMIEKSDVVAAGLGVTNYPNPVVSSSTVRFAVPEDGYTSVKLYDVVGNEVMTLSDGFINAGTEYTANLEAAGLSNGTYICKLVSGSFSAVTTVTIVK